MVGRTSPVPFITSSIVSAAVTLWVLILAGKAPGKPVRSAAAAEARQVPFVDYHQDVAHEEDLLPPALSGASRWLLRHQDPEGCWGSADFTLACGDRVCTGRGRESYDLGVTALATLALLESGQEKEHEPAIRRALGWLGSRQSETGTFGPRGGKSAYAQAIATLAFARAAALFGDPAHRAAAERGVWALQAAQNHGSGWRYGSKDGQSDTSVTAWSGLALTAAASPEVGVFVGPSAFEGIRRWLAEATGDHGGVSYMRRGAASSSVPGIAGRFEPNEGLTASALWLRLEMGEDRRKEELASAAKRLLWNLPVWTADGRSVDFLAWYAGTRALASWGAREPWAVWSARVLRVLALHQHRYHEGCLAGSWDPDDKWGGEGGRVYATSVNLLTLGVVQRMRARAK